MEEGLEEEQTVGVEYNYDSFDLDSIFDKLTASEGLPEELKRNLYFLKSDQ